MLKLAAPVLDGVPEITPVLEFTVKPLGKVPVDTDQVSGAVPPVATTGCEYTVPTVPPCREVVVIDGAAETVMDSACVAKAPRPSVTLMVKPGAVAVGVPEIRPLLELILSPAGSEPADTDQVSDPVPPDAATVWEYAVPMVAPGIEEVEIDGAAETVMVSTLVAEALAASVTCMVKLGAVAVGVPEMRPLEEFKLSPAGSEPDTVQVRGAVPPDAATVWEYAVPIVAPGNEVVVIEGAAETVMDSACVANAPRLSVTFMVKPPAVAVGVPEIRPLVEMKPSPAGRAPADTDQVSEPVPPDPATVWEYAVPMVAPGNVVVEIDGAAETVMESAFVAKAPTPSVTLMVKPGAVAVGVPEIRPLVELMPSPAGRAPADTDQVSEPVPPDAATV
jgi:hypothetical protein